MIMSLFYLTILKIMLRKSLARTLPRGLERQLVSLLRRQWTFRWRLLKVFTTLHGFTETQQLEDQLESLASSLDSKPLAKNLHSAFTMVLLVWSLNRTRALETTAQSVSSKALVWVSQVSYSRILQQS